MILFKNRQNLNAEVQGIFKESVQAQFKYDLSISCCEKLVAEAGTVCEPRGGGTSTIGSC
jgi:hypothetical protein